MEIRLARLCKVFLILFISSLMGVDACSYNKQSESATTINCPAGSLPQSIPLCSSTDAAPNEGEGSQSNDIECEGAQPQFVSCGGTLLNVEENQLSVGSAKGNSVVEYVIRVQY